MFRIDRDQKSRPFFLLLLCLTMGAVCASALCAAPSCETATRLDPDATLRSFASFDEEQIWRLDVPSSGMLTVDLLTDPDRTDGWIDLLFDACDTTSGALVVEQSATHLVLAVPAPDTLFFHAGHLEHFQLVGSYDS